MPVVNADVAAIADLLEVQGANGFRVRAYRNASRVLSELGRSVKTMVDRGEDLDALPAIGPDLAAKIIEVVSTGSCALLERLRRELPPTVTELLKVRGLGPRRVRALHAELGIGSLAELHAAAEAGRVRSVHGFGPKLQQVILDATIERLHEEHRFKRSVATELAETILGELAAVPGVEQAVAAGSLRRARDTVGDLDLLVTAREGSAVIEKFASAAAVSRVLSRGGTRASVVLTSGLQVDLRAVPPESFGAAWLYFTGSKAHSIALRKLAQDKGLLLNEYGLYRGDHRIAGTTESSVYRALGLAFIEPELRENRGEITAARERRLPTLVQLADLCGDLHAHTNESDGRDSLEAMADAAHARGLQYLAITDHSRRLTVAHGLDADRLARQIDRIDELNARRQGAVLLKGVEVDLPNSILRRLDLVVGAVHHRFDLPRDRQTERLLRAMDHPCFSILAHPTGRLIDERPGCDIDLVRVLRKARERGCFVELNAQPQRLDLDDLACRMARDEGVLVSIASDAHGALEFGHLRDGIGQARRGWLEASDVLNARSLDALRPLLNVTMGRSTVAARPAVQDVNSVHAVP